MDFFSLRPATALIAAPHADDEILGAGGLIARLSLAGWSVRVAYMTVAGFASQLTGTRTPCEERWKEAISACKVIGAVPHGVLYRDGINHLRLDQVPQAELITFLERVMSEVSPQIFIYPAEGHFHQDHRATSDACITVLRPGSAAARSVDVALAYGPSHLWWGKGGAEFRPNVFVDISMTLEKKLAALKCYASQVMPSPHPRSLEAVRAYATYYGVTIGAAFGEPYVGSRILVR